MIFWKPDMCWWWSIDWIHLNILGLYVLSGMKSTPQHHWTGNPVYWVYVSIVLWRIHPESTIFEPKTVDSWILRSGKLTNIAKETQPFCGYLPGSRWWLFHGSCVSLPEGNFMVQAIEPGKLRFFSIIFWVHEGGWNPAVFFGK